VNKTAVKQLLIFIVVSSPSLSYIYTQASNFMVSETAEPRHRNLRQPHTPGPNPQIG
jgi:hypothetical protein